MRNLRILGPSLLALVGVMAVSASAAQAKWLLLENGVAKSLLTLAGSVGLLLMLVRDSSGTLIFSLHCTGGTFTKHIKTENNAGELKVDGERLLLSSVVIFTGCQLEDSKGVVNKNCSVHSPGKAAGTIQVEGSGEGKMEGTKTFAQLESPEFTFIEIDGALCPLNENDAEISGSATLTVDEAEKSLETHSGSLDEKALLYGENKAILMPTATEEGPIKGSAKLESGGGTWAIQLCGLGGGTPAC